MSEEQGTATSGLAVRYPYYAAKLAGLEPAERDGGSMNNGAAGEASRVLRRPQTDPGRYILRRVPGRYLDLL